LICAQCCGEKRVLEIRCPDDCQYLKTGRSHEVRQENLRHLRSSDPVQSLKYRRVFAELGDVLAALEYVIAEQRLTSKELSDKDVHQALELVLETLRTEDRGILYEQTSNDLRVEMVRKALAAVVATHRRPVENQSAVTGLSPGAPAAVKLKDAIDALEVLHGIVSSHMSGSASMSYVDFLARQLPARKSLKDVGSSIIIPGR
jgi:hypothetical protein